MKEKQVLKQLTSKYSQYASWALYQVSDQQLQISDDKEKVRKKDVTIEPFRDKLEESINLNGIFLGLNCSRQISSDINETATEWSNFHDTSQYSQDYKIPYMIKGTKYEGSYMTDLFKNFPMVNSNQFEKNIVKPENRSIYNTSVELFQEEYNIIKPKTIICFGDKVEKFLTDMIKNEELTVDSNVEIIKIKHYSAQLSYECLKKESDKLR